MYLKCNNHLSLYNLGIPAGCYFKGLEENCGIKSISFVHLLIFYSTNIFGADHSVWCLVMAWDGECHSFHGVYILEGFRYRTSKDVIYSFGSFGSQKGRLRLRHSSKAILYRDVVSISVS